MNYPLISEYIESIKSAEDNFEKLSYLKPILDVNGLPVMTSGNFAVVFKMMDETTGKFYALKCFTKEQEGRAEAYLEITKELKDVSSPYLVSVRYLEKELFVDTEQTSETEFPVLLMDWVEGKTLDKYLRENLDDKYALEMLAYRFSQLAKWLIPQPYAHGDLKPDNILIREDGTLVLVDYDGMYVPAMKGQKARELGSPDFRHPLRNEYDFDEHIDDFPIVSILFSLKAISINPLTLEKYGASDRLLFSRGDYINLNNSIIGQEITPILNAEDCRNIMSILLLLLHSRVYPVNSLKLLSIYFEGLDSERYELLPIKLRETIERAMIGDSDEQNSLGYCFYYGENLSQNYTKAFYWYKVSSTHNNPKALYNIGVCFQNGTGVHQSYKEALIWFKKAAVLGDADAQYNVGQYYRRDKFGIGIDLKESFYWFKKAADQNKANAQDQLGYFYANGKGGVKKDLEEAFRLFKLAALQGYSYGQYHVAKCYWEGAGVIRDYNEAMIWYKYAAEQGHEKAQEIINKWKDTWWDGTAAIYSADKKILKGGWSLYFDEYNILEGTKEICDNAFFDQRNEIDFSYLVKVTIPSSVVSIGQCPFNKYLSQITCLSPHFEVDNNTLYSKGKDRLIQCFAKTNEFIIPNEVKRIDDFAFYGCTSKRIIIGKNVKSIGLNPFYEIDPEGNELVIESISPNYEIKNSCLCENGHKLITYFGNDRVYRVHDDIELISDYAFSSSLLEIVHLPKSLREISDKAFSACSRLKYASAPIDIALRHSNNGAINSYLLMLEDNGNMSEVEMGIIQAIYRQIPLDEIVEPLGIDFDELEEKLEELITSGWKLDIDYFLNDVMDEENINTIYEYIETHKDYSLWLLTKKLNDHFSEDEIRLVRIKYLSENQCSNNVKNESKVDDLPF